MKINKRVWWCFVTNGPASWGWCNGMGNSANPEHDFCRYVQVDPEDD